MAEYWKSLPRKFCDICKCWFADNKASIDFHERGKRHKENAQKRIQEIQKRGIKEFKKQQELENEMEKIEKAALAAYKKDLQAMQQSDKPQVEFKIPTNKSSSKPQKRTSEPNVRNQSANNVPKKQKLVKPEEVPTEISTVQKVWYEAMTDEGYKYYWNTETSESQWDPPEEGFISIEEQNLANHNSEKEEQQKSPEESNSAVEEEKLDKEEKLDNDIPCTVGPQPKVDPYGQWVTVQQEEPVKYDLQLPKVSENVVEVVIPLHKEESVKFKEKVVGQLSDTDAGEVTFKKRKICSAKNARQRNTDDD